MPDGDPFPDLAFFAIPGLPLVRPGDDLPALLIAGLQRANLAPAGGDVLVLAQKIVSKSENRFVDLAGITPSAEATELAAKIEKDPRLVHVILSESRRVVRARPNLLIVEHRDGFVMANAGVDHSNVAADDGREIVLLLPRDSDASAAALRDRLQSHFACRLGVIIADSFGRPWRSGTLGVAVGAAGIPSLRDMRGQPDLFGRALRVTETGFADEIAAAATILMGQAAEGRPAVLVRGLDLSGPQAPARALVRPPEHDLFR